MISEELFTELMVELHATATVFVEAQEPLDRGDFAAPQFEDLKRALAAINAHWQADTRGIKGDA